MDYYLIKNKKEKSLSQEIRNERIYLIMWPDSIIITYSQHHANLQNHKLEKISISAPWKIEWLLFACLTGHSQKDFNKMLLDTVKLVLTME